MDGVLTGGEIIILNSGEEIKIWSVKDRMGLAMLRDSKLSVKLAWVTARKSRQVAVRAKELGIHFLFQRCLDKWQAVQQCARKLNLRPDQIAYVGDDMVDLNTLKHVGLAVCPPESPDELKKVCHLTTKTPSGKGVIREVIDLLIKSQGAWKKTISGFSVLALLFIAGCYAPPTTPADFADKPDQWVEKFTITETRSGVPVWVLNSEIAKFYNSQSKVVLDNIKIEFMSMPPSVKKRSKESLMQAKKAQTLSARLSAPKGEVQTVTRDLSAWGGVHVQSQDGSTLSTERLNYSAARQRVWTESHVKIVRKESTLIGEGMEATPDLSTVKIFKHRAEIYPKEMGIK